MVKKKIIIVNNNLHIGGVQKALISLLWNIKDEYDVTLLLFNKAGECVKDLPPDVKVITEAGAYRYIGMTKDDIHSLSDKLGRSFFAAISRVFGRKYAVKLMALSCKTVKGYDIAISYLQNAGDKAFYGGCNDFVLNHVDADKKITFLHCDYMECGANTQENARQYAMFDKIAACSQGCADSFIKALPNLKEKVSVVNNCHCFEEISKSAEKAAVELKKDRINFVTAARLGKEKGVERAVSAISKLGTLKDKMHYFILGDGIQKELIEQIIKDNGLEQTVTLCGMIENPYGYIKAADVLLIPSYSEAAPLVIGEAAYLGTPVLSTATCSAKDMIEQTGYGWVCGNTDEGILEGIAEILESPNAVSEAKKKIESNKINNYIAVEQFAAIIS